MGEYECEEFRTIDELCDLVFKFKKGWGSTWYRGSSSAKHKLLPTLFRGKNREKEIFNSLEFRRRARMIDNTVSSQLDFLCLMQHYGLETRLLDWTESLSVALYFTSCGPDKRNYSPTVWMLEPFELGKLNGFDAVLSIATDPDVINHCDIAFQDNSDGKDNKYKKFPVPVLPDFSSRRLAAQEGVFTIHGTDERSLEVMIPENKRKYLKKFTLKKGHERYIRKKIRLVMPNGNSLFPDIDGIGRYLIDHEVD
jgi:hypothetical protein